jgi:chromosome segregation ATPase
MKTDKPRIYWTVKSAHYGSNRYIFDTLSLAENEITRLKKQYPHEKTELTQLVESSAVEQLEQRVKELEQQFESSFDKHQAADWELNQTKRKLAEAEAKIKELTNDIQGWVKNKLADVEKIAAQERVINYLESVIFSTSVTSSGIDTCDSDSDMYRFSDTYRNQIRQHLEQLTKESK